MQILDSMEHVQADPRSHPDNAGTRDARNAVRKAMRHEPPIRSWSHGRRSETLGSFHCRTIVVEGSVAAADALATALREHGHETVAVYAHDDAVETVASFAPSAVLIDLDGPGSSHEAGCAIARDVRRLHLSPQPILLACSDRTDEPGRGEARRAGFDYHLLKPVGADEVARIVRAGILGARAMPC